MKEKLIEIGKDLATGAVVFVTSVVVLTGIAFYTDYGLLAGKVSAIYGYSLALFGVYFTGKKIRAKLTKKAI